VQPLGAVGYVFFLFGDPNARDYTGPSVNHLGRLTSMSYQLTKNQTKNETKTRGQKPDIYLSGQFGEFTMFQITTQVSQTIHQSRVSGFECGFEVDLSHLATTWRWQLRPNPQR
jgi:hypothetical protein